MVFGSSVTSSIFRMRLNGARRVCKCRKIDSAAGSSERARAIKQVVGRAAADIETYVWVQTITGVMLTASAVIVMLAVRLDNLMFWAVIFFLLTFILVRIVFGIYVLVGWYAELVPLLSAGSLHSPPVAVILLVCSVALTSLNIFWAHTMVSKAIALAKGKSE